MSYVGPAGPVKFEAVPANATAPKPVFVQVGVTTAFSPASSTPLPAPSTTSAVGPTNDAASQSSPCASGTWVEKLVMVT